MKKTLTALLVLIAVIAQADDRRAERNKKNYILRRQEIGAVQGTPSIRLINGKREVDVYRNGMIFDKDNLVGVRVR